MADLYPGIAFSPQAALTNNIGAADSIIKVSDVSAFPPAPNLATIGTDEEGETILYTAKTADALSGCQRGVEGEARAWSAGELIGRNFTAKDHADLIAAVGESKTAAETAQEFAEGLADSKQDALSGQPGQVVGFDADGTAQAVRGWSSPNLLDNWYFVDPIIQRGITDWPNGHIYGIDRWKLTYGNAIVAPSVGVTLTGGNVDNVIFQLLEKERLILGREYTVSCLASDNTLLATTFTASKMHEIWTQIAEVTENGLGLRMVSGNLAGTCWSVDIFNIDGQSHTLVAAKLEPGPQQTLAHQDADGKWVLNDPPPNKALELAKCQRYFVRYNGRSLLGFGVSYSTEGATVQVWLPVPMRAMPLVVVNGDIKLVSAFDTATASKILVVYRSQNEITLDVVSGSLTIGRVERLDLAEGSYLDFNADL